MELLIGDTAQNIVLIESLKESGELVASALHGVDFSLQSIDLFLQLRAVLGY